MNMVLRFQRQRNIKGWVCNKYKILDVASRNMKIQMIKLQKFKISMNFQEIKYQIMNFEWKTIQDSSLHVKK
jgi:hypothetical protein